MNEVNNKVESIEIPVLIGDKSGSFFLDQAIAKILPLLWIEVVTIIDNRILLRNIFTGEPVSLIYNRENSLYDWGIDFFNETLEEVRRSSTAKTLTKDNYNEELTHFFNVLYNKFFDYCYKQGTVFTWKMGGMVNTFIVDMLHPEKAIMIADNHVYEYYNKRYNEMKELPIKTYRCVSDAMQLMLDARKSITMRGVRLPTTYNKVMEENYRLKTYYLEKERLNAINGKGSLVLQSKS